MNRRDSKPSYAVPRWWSGEREGKEGKDGEEGGAVGERTAPLKQTPQHPPKERK